MNEIEHGFPVFEVSFSLVSNHAPVFRTVGEFQHTM